MDIRILTKQDVTALTEIDSQAFTKPWSASSFDDELNKDYSYCIAAEDGGITAGYAIIWCIYETAELIRIAVHPKFQNQGIADKLMDSIISGSISKSCKYMLLEVRKSNIAAINLYRKHEFNQISVRRGYYDGEDALIMERKF